MKLIKDNNTNKLSDYIFNPAFNQIRKHTTDVVRNQLTIKIFYQSENSTHFQVKQLIKNEFNTK